MSHQLLDDFYVFSASNQQCCIRVSKGMPANPFCMPALVAAGLTNSAVPPTVRVGLVVPKPVRLIVIGP